MSFLLLESGSFLLLEDGASKLILETGTTPTTTALTSSLNPSTYFRNVTFTATVSDVTATGTVTFFDGVSSIGTGALSSGVATLTTPALTIGSHSMTAVYGGDSTFTGSTSSPLTETVNTPGNFTLMGQICT